MENTRNIDMAYSFWANALCARSRRMAVKIARTTTFKIRAVLPLRTEINNSYGLSMICGASVEDHTSPANS
jgi:hypothetical protein